MAVSEQFYPGEVVHRSDLTTTAFVGETITRVEGPRHAWLSREAAAQLLCSLQERERFAAALIDPLTQLKNLNGLMDDIPRYQAHANHTGKRFMVMRADLTALFLVNKQAGTKIGDMYLRAAADSLRQGLQPDDQVYRPRGDEFDAILVVNPLQKVMVEALEGNLRGRFTSILARQIQQQPALSELSQELPLGISIGLATWDPRTVTFDEAMHQADERMFTHKTATGSTRPQLT